MNSGEPFFRQRVLITLKRRTNNLTLLHLLGILCPRLVSDPFGDHLFTSTLTEETYDNITYL